jgi:integrase
VLEHEPDCRWRQLEPGYESLHVSLADARQRPLTECSTEIDYVADHVGRRHDGFVLHRRGEPVDWQAFGHQWRKTRKKAGLDSIRYHDLRHAFASMLISAGCSVKAVSVALGHSSAATTLTCTRTCGRVMRTGSVTRSTRGEQESTAALVRG